MMTLHKIILTIRYHHFFSIKSFKYQHCLTATPCFVVKQPHVRTSDSKLGPMSEILLSISSFPKWGATVPAFFWNVFLPEKSAIHNIKGISHIQVECVKILCVATDQKRITQCRMMEHVKKVQTQALQARLGRQQDSGPRKPGHRLHADLQSQHGWLPGAFSHDGVWMIIAKASRDLRSREGPKEEACMGAERLVWEGEMGVCNRPRIAGSGTWDPIPSVTPSLRHLEAVLAKQSTPTVALGNVP